jgi:hypothetical protein
MNSAHSLMTYLNHVNQMAYSSLQESRRAKSSPSATGTESTQPASQNRQPLSGDNGISIQGDQITLDLESFEALAIMLLGAWQPYLNQTTNPPASTPPVDLSKDGVVSAENSDLFLKMASGKTRPGQAGSNEMIQATPGQVQRFAQAVLRGKYDNDPNLTDEQLYDLKEMAIWVNRQGFKFVSQLDGDKTRLSSRDLQMARARDGDDETLDFKLDIASPAASSRYSRGDTSNAPEGSIIDQLLNRHFNSADFIQNSEDFAYTYADLDTDKFLLEKLLDQATNKLDKKSFDHLMAGEDQYGEPTPFTFTQMIANAGVLDGNGRDGQELQTDNGLADFLRANYVPHAKYLNRKEELANAIVRDLKAEWGIKLDTSKNPPVVVENYYKDDPAYGKEADAIAKLLIELGQREPKTV